MDDHRLLVDGLKAQFETDGRVRCLGTLDSADALVEAAERLDPDVVLLDVEMPGADAFEMADRLRQRRPNQRFAFLSAHVRDGYLSAAYRCGAWGYFAKGDELDDIVGGLVEIARSRQGTFVMGPKVREQCAPSGGHAGPPRSSLDMLTDREVEVLRLIGKGLSRSEIAAELCRSAKTIDGHQDRMLKKLGVNSRAELMRLAIREGLAEA
ncbi:MAG: response regulator transcription factor [Phycisphaeraceae bacterium]|nr:response regulator transcription factor [Phycisphaeraceae bacterium]